MSNITGGDCHVFDRFQVFVEHFFSLCRQLFAIVIFRRLLRFNRTSVLHFRIFVSNRYSRINISIQCPPLRTQGCPRRRYFSFLGSRSYGVLFEFRNEKTQISPLYLGIRVNLIDNSERDFFNSYNGRTIEKRINFTYLVYI